MPDDWIDEWVKAEMKKKTREVDQGAADRVATVIEEQNFRDVLDSTMTLDRCGDVVREGIRSLVRARLDLEGEAHRRERVVVSDDRARKIEEDLCALVNHRLADGINAHSALKGIGSRMGHDHWGRFINDLRVPLMDEAKDGIDALSLDLQRPTGGGGDTYIQNINAPNHGVIASRIETLSIGPAGESVKEALREILKASSELTEVRQEEVRNLIAGLVKEVERGSDANAVAAATMTDRLKEALQTGANIAAVAQLFAPLADWIAKLATG